jgi:hypothetical protein
MAKKLKKNGKRFWSTIKKYKETRQVKKKVDAEDNK